MRERHRKKVKVFFWNRNQEQRDSSVFLGLNIKEIHDKRKDKSMFYV